MIRHLHRLRTTRTRTGFTLPEVLVVTVLFLIIMGILAECFRLMSDGLRNAKAQGDMMDQQKMVMTILRNDLSKPFFLEDDTKPNQGQRLRDLRYDQFVAPAGQPITGCIPPRGGYFRAYSPRIDNVINIDEGADANGIASSRSVNHFLMFTVLLPGGAPQNTFTADVPYPNGRLISQQAEVAYFWVQRGQTSTGVRYGDLIRRVRIAARADDAQAYQLALTTAVTPVAPTNQPPDPTPGDVVAVNGNNPPGIRTLIDLTDPANRLANPTLPLPTLPTPPLPTIAAGPRIGEDILLSNVTSFEIKFAGIPSPSMATQGIIWPTPFATNSDFPFDNLPFDGQFDTFHRFTPAGAEWYRPTNLATTPPSTAPLKPIRILAIMVRLRTWDQKSKNSRQTTLIVDL